MLDKFRATVVCAILLDCATDRSFKLISTYVLGSLDPAR